MAESKSGLMHSSVGSLAKYDPHKGVKKIAVAEMAEKHYAKAKDASKLVAAIRAKLEAQAEFVLWWDTKGPGTNHGGDRKSTSRSRFQTGNLDSKDWKKEIHRWRVKLNDPDKFEQTFQAACAKYPKLLEFMTTAHVGHNTGEYEWYTPVEYVEAARSVLGDIDLDPATSDAANTVVKAAQIFTPADDGLKQAWHGRVWMNPPYSQPEIELFCSKLAVSYASGDITAAIVLVNNATETAWFQTLADVACALCFPRGRVQFWSPRKESASPLQGQAVIYAGQNVETFLNRFASFGVVATIVRRCE